jgi:SAM-dependent methyltransferase
VTIVAGLDELLEEAARRPLVGWDLSYDGRARHDAPWDFEAIADARLAGATRVLDMGTGGGEWLGRRPFPKGRTVATEAWAPNVPVATARLAPLGAAVVAVQGAPDNADQVDTAVLPALPFADGAFNLVTNRHESFVAAEVARVLAPDGRFLTQQVSSDFDAPLRALLGAPPRAVSRPWRQAVAADQLARGGLVVTEGGDGDAVLTFADAGALAWYLIHVPWVMPDFEIARYRPRLEQLQPQAPFTVRQPMFWLAAVKPAAERQP